MAYRCQLCEEDINGARFTVLGKADHADPAGWLTLLLIEGGDVETNPGPTTTHKQYI